MSERAIRVTDKRIFTPEGDLREEFRYLEDAAETPPTPAAAASPAPGTPSASAEPLASSAPQSPPSSAPAFEIPGPPSAYGMPTFFDLLGVLAEPASIYLGDVPLPGGQSGEDLEMAKLHIDLLAVLRQKTSGNLTAQEVTVLDDLLYRLRMRFVQKRG